MGTSLWERLLRLRRILWADHRLEHMEALLRLQQADLRRLGEQLDLLKSSLQMDRDLARGYAAWRLAHPLGARPLVSVLAATYDRARLLTERCLPSILSQAYDPLEVIVVGDGCTDDTAAAVERLGDCRVRFVNLPQRGPYPQDPERRWLVAGSAPANAALALARGELITHLDDDDEYLPGRISKLVAFLRETDADLVWHPFWSEGAPGVFTLNESPHFAFGGVTTSSVIYRAWFARMPFDVEAHRLGEPADWNRFRRMQFEGTRLRRFPEPLLRHYRERSRAEYAGSATPNSA